MFVLSMRTNILFFPLIFCSLSENILVWSPDTRKTLCLKRVLSWILLDFNYKIIFRPKRHDFSAVSAGLIDREVVFFPFRTDKVVRF